MYYSLLYIQPHSYLLYITFKQVITSFYLHYKSTLSFLRFFIAGRLPLVSRVRYINDIRSMALPHLVRIGNCSQHGFLYLIPDQLWYSQSLNAAGRRQNRTSILIDSFNHIISIRLAQVTFGKVVITVAAGTPNILTYLRTVQTFIYSTHHKSMERHTMLYISACFTCSYGIIIS